MADATKNFAFSLVATAPSPAASGTSLVVTAGDGAKFPTAPFYAVCWPAGTQPSSTNAEVIRVTAVSTDTFTITRAQDGSTAQSIAVGWNVDNNLVAGFLGQLMATSTYDPAGVAQQVVGTTATQTLTNKTLTSPSLNSPSLNGVVVTGTPAVGNVLTATSATAADWAALAAAPLATSSAYLSGSLSIPGSSAALVNLTSLSLPAGTYLLIGTMYAMNGSAASYSHLALGPTSGSFTGAYGGSSGYAPASEPIGLSTFNLVTLAATTTVYLLADASGSAGATAYDAAVGANDTGIIAIKVA